MSNLVEGLEKRYDKGWMEVETTTGVDGEKYHELVYDSCLVAKITEENNGVNDVYTVVGFLRGHCPVCENVYINPTEDELVNAVDDIISAIERAEERVAKIFSDK